jgi:hypothetical protein
MELGARAAMGGGADWRAGIWREGGSAARVWLRSAAGQGNRNGGGARGRDGEESEAQARRIGRGRSSVRRLGKLRECP